MDRGQSSGNTCQSSYEEEQKVDKIYDVMFLCNEWKSSKGGLSSFNREFAVNLAKTSSESIKVHCYVSQSDQMDREDARQHGINLITARNIPGSTDPLDWLKLPPPELPSPDIVIGHGRKFGTPAFFIVQTAKCKWIHFVHVFCEDLGKFKATGSDAVDTIEENEKKHEDEISLCKEANAVVAVGSRLQHKYSRSLPNVKVEMITPGILERFCSESSPLTKVGKKFNVFMFGRASSEDVTLKGYDIVADAIGSLGKKFELTFVGSSTGEHRNVEQWFFDNSCIKRKQLTIRSYCNEQDKLRMMFREADLVTLPSRTEGFGLVALEAISAGVPVLVSDESGIADALEEVEGGNSVIVESDNARKWEQKIQQLSSQTPEERDNNAKLLRENYRKTHSWSTECEKFKRLIQNLMEGLHIICNPDDANGDAASPSSSDYTEADSDREGDLPTGPRDADGDTDLPSSSGCKETDNDRKGDSAAGPRASQDIEKGSSIGQKRKRSCSSNGNQGNLKITKCESSQQASKPALDQDSCKNGAVLAERPMAHFPSQKDKSDNDNLATDANGDTASPSSSGCAEADTERKGDLATGPRDANGDTCTASPSSLDYTEADSDRKGDLPTGPRDSCKIGAVQAERPVTHFANQKDKSGNGNVAAGQCGSNLLHSASYGGNVAIIETMLSRGFDINSKDTNGNTPLTTAAACGKMEAVNYLLDKGADASLKGRYGRNLLHCASYGGNVAIIETMLSRSFDINSKDTNGNTPLTIAALSGKMEAVNYLLDKGADAS